MNAFTPAPGSTLLFEGDSLTGFRAKPCLDTWAWQRLTGAHYGYPEKVGDWLFCQRPDLRLSCRNGAVGGSIMADVLERFPTITGALKPGLVVMTIGSNDATRDIPIDVFGEQVAEFCRQLHACSQGRVVYLGNLVSAHGASESTGKRREKAKAYYTRAAAAVSAHHGLVVDLGSVMQHKSEQLAQWWPGHSIYHDGGHFNQVGNEIVAGVVLRALGLMTTPGDPSYADP